MENCTLVNIDRCSLYDGPGIRTVIFFKGCYLRCVWCHNPETYKFGIQEYEEMGEKKSYGYNTNTDEIKKIILQDMDYYKSSGGGVTLSGGEALLQIEAAVDLAKFCKENQIHLCIETSGQVPPAFIKLIEEYVDCWLYDYKLSNEEDYKKLVKAQPKLIYENFNYLVAQGRKIILRCPVIPTLNDNQQHFQRIAELSKKVSSVEILPYHNLGKQKANNLHIKNYFEAENTSQESKDQWWKQLTELGCQNFSVN